MKKKANMLVPIMAIKEVPNTHQMQVFSARPQRIIAARIPVLVKNMMTCVAACSGCHGVDCNNS